MSNYRSTTATNTGATVSSVGVNVSQVNIINRHSAVIYVKFYDSDVATFQDTPLKTYAVAASGGALNLIGNKFLFGTSHGLAVRVVTDNTDAGNTAAATLPIIELEYN